MERVKAFVLRNFEMLTLLAVFSGVVIMNWLVIPDSSFLSFYFLPCLLAGHFLGLRPAVLFAVLSVCFVVFLRLVNPAGFTFGDTLLETATSLVCWGGFLILTAYVIGRLREKTKQAYNQLNNAYIGILEILSIYIESGDPYTLGHSTRVAHLSKEIASVMGLSPDQIERCRVAGLLHDIGKVEVSIDVVRKAAALTQEEKAIISTHASDGARMIDSLGAILGEVVPVIENHHLFYAEAKDSAAEIPQETFVVAVADAYDAIVTDRPYRAGKAPQAAIAELENCAGTQFLSMFA